MAISLDEVVEFALRQVVGIQQLSQQIATLREENERLKKEVELHGKTVVPAEKTPA